MSTFSTIKAQIISKVQAQTSYFDTDAVYNYEPEIGDVIKDPFAVVIASGNENEFASSSENKRQPGFIIRVFVERKQRGVSSAESLMVSIMDALVDVFDQDFTLGSTVLISKAAPSRWGYVLGDKEYRTAEITIQTQSWFNTT